MQAILDFIKTNKNPVILAGDFNNFENSAESTSIKRIVTRRISDPAYLIRTVATYFNPYGLTTNAASNTIGFARKYCDPTVRGIPIILPNKARGLFKLIQDFEFDDNNHFDFTGTKQFSSKARKGYLSNSNQRAKKGFVETFEFKRSFKVAKYKIDWIMVKPLRLAACHDYDFEDLDYRCKNYFPAFGKTLKDLNFSPKNLVSISDHSPVSLQIFCDHRTE